MSSLIFEGLQLNCTCYSIELNIVKTGGKCPFDFRVKDSYTEFFLEKMFIDWIFVTLAGTPSVPLFGRNSCANICCQGFKQVD